MEAQATAGPMERTRDCPRCGRPNPRAASFCGRCATPLAVRTDIGRLSGDGSAALDIRPAGAVLETPALWTWGADGASLYLFHAGSDNALRIAHVEARGGAAAPANLAVGGPRQGVRGVAVSRRGAFIAQAGGLIGALAPTTIDGTWTGMQTPLRGAEIVGVAGAGAHLLIACLEQDRLTLKRWAGGSEPTVAASARWRFAHHPGWLRVLAQPGSDLAWLWGGGVCARIDLALGEMTLASAEDAPVAALPLEQRDEHRACLETPRASGAAGYAPVPLADKNWGLMDLKDGRVTPMSSDLQQALCAAVGAGGRNLVAVCPGFVLHATLADGRLAERRMTLDHIVAGALVAGEHTAAALVTSQDQALRLVELDLTSGVPSIRAQAELRPAAMGGAYANPSFPPLAMRDGLLLGAPEGGQLALWDCAFAEAAA